MRKKSASSKKQNIIKVLFFAALSAIFMAVSLTYPSLHYLAYVALVPLIMTTNDRSVWFRLGVGAFTGVVYYALILYWTRIFTLPTYAVMVIVQSFWIMLFTAFIPRTNATLRYVFTPAIWVLFQWLHAVEPYTFTYGSFFHIMASDLLMSRAALLIGIFGIEFVVCLTNIAASDFLSYKRFKPFAISALILFACYQYGYIAVKENPKQKPLLTQTQVYEQNKASLADMVKYTRTKKLPKPTYSFDLKSDSAAYLSGGICIFALAASLRKGKKRR